MPTHLQIEQLQQEGIPLDLAFTSAGAEGVLFAYNDFYVELVVECSTDEILAIHCFKSLQKLERYLQQIDISEIVDLLQCN